MASSRSFDGYYAIVVIAMASVAKWLRQRIVVPPPVGSNPIVRPTNTRTQASPGKAARCHQLSIVKFTVIFQQRSTCSLSGAGATAPRARERAKIS